MLQSCLHCSFFAYHVFLLAIAVCSDGTVLFLLCLHTVGQSFISAVKGCLIIIEVLANAVVDSRMALDGQAAVCDEVPNGQNVALKRQLK